MKTSAANPTINGKVYHLQAAKGDIADVVLLPGDPGRVALVAPLFDIDAEDIVI